MNPSKKEEAEDLFDFYRQILKKKKIKNVIVAPPFLCLPLFSQKGVLLSGQNCFWQNQGPFTGEISPLMLKSFGIDYVILGHSERRNYQKETNKEIAKKVGICLKNNLTPIICFGEKKEEREKNLTKKVIFSQLRVFSFLSQKKFSKKKFFLAYEPVWAIGAGKPCPKKEVEKISLYLKNFLLEMKISPKRYSFLYGGSLDSKNIKNYYSPLLDGFLIGGASLKKREVKKIIERCQF